MNTVQTFLYGLHDAGGEQLFLDAQVQGWVIFNEFVGQDPADFTGVDYSSWADRGFGGRRQTSTRLQSAGHHPGTSPI